MNTKTTSLLLGLCLSVTLLAAACGQKAAESKSKPVAKEPALQLTGPAKIVAAEPVFNFGEVEQGQKVEHVFKISNQGGEQLDIKGAKGS
jgi:hypothetical protein